MFNETGSSNITRPPTVKTLRYDTDVAVTERLQVAFSSVNEQTAGSDLSVDIAMLNTRFSTVTNLDPNT